VVLELVFVASVEFSNVLTCADDALETPNLFGVVAAAVVASVEKLARK
jgi:hypothetical protein